MAKKTPSKVTKASRPDKRKSTRFAPDPGALAYVLTGADGKKLSHPLPCLIVEEAYAGCGLICLKNVNILKGALIDVQVGQLPRLKAEIRWTKMLDSKAIYFGLTYLD